MNNTMLVRTGSGKWEKLRPQATMPSGGITDVFGNDIGPVIGSAEPIVVAASAPKMDVGKPDALCVDADGNVWVVRAALEGDTNSMLPDLLAIGGGLTGMSFEQFQELCNQASPGTLADFMKTHTTRTDFHASTFEHAVTESLALGRFHMVAMVQEANPTLVQSLRYLNSQGAKASLYEASSFASETVTAVNARAVDVGLIADPVQVHDVSAGALIVATGKATDEKTAGLMEQLQKACEEQFDDVRFTGDTSQGKMDAIVTSDEGALSVVSADHEGNITINVSELAAVDGNWTIRAELVQGLERLLGGDLGEVREVTDVSMSITEHLNDSTLMDALVDQLTETVQLVRENQARSSKAERAAA